MLGGSLATGTGAYTLISATGGLTLDNFGITGTLPGYTLALSGDENNIYLDVTAVAVGGNYWDGNGIVVGGGGDGTWTSSSATFATDGTYATSGLAQGTGTIVFAGTAGNVIVDNVSGPVAANAGLQFSTDGYEVSGGTLTLGGSIGANTITVDTDMTATIGVDLTADSGITKAGAGTLKLTAATIYSGDTALDAGTLELAPSSGPLTYGGKISGVGNLAKSGASLVRLTAATVTSRTRWPWIIPRRAKPIIMAGAIEGNSETHDVGSGQGEKRVAATKSREPKGINHFGPSL
jgi:autotransporter-associated beta strand protein